MLVGALNYTNNAALLLTCLLAVIAAGSALSTFRNMNGLHLDAIKADTAHAGSPIHVTLELGATSPPRHALAVEVAGQVARFNIDGLAARSERNRQSVPVRLPTSRRGWLDMPELRLACSWPFGLFRAWVRVRPDQRLLVYPRAERGGPPPPGNTINRPMPRNRQQQVGGDDLAALRRYHPGDSRKQVAWKASARHEHLLVREFRQQLDHDELRLDWQDTRELEPEARIARLARWIDEANAHCLRWSLHVPGYTLGPDTGTNHYHRCMRCLALLPDEDTARMHD